MDRTYRETLISMQANVTDSSTDWINFGSFYESEKWMLVEIMDKIFLYLLQPYYNEISNRLDATLASTIDSDMKIPENVSTTRTERGVDLSLDFNFLAKCFVLFNTNTLQQTSDRIRLEVQSVETRKLAKKTGIYKNIRKKTIPILMN